MRFRISDVLLDVYEMGILKDDEELDNLLAYIPTKNGKHKDGVFIKDNKIIRQDIKLGNPVWEAIDPILGSTEDENIAWFFGMPTPLIEQRRKVKRILPYGFIQWSIIDPLFDLASDADIVELFEGIISMEVIKERREYLENLDDE